MGILMLPAEAGEMQDRTKEFAMRKVVAWELVSLDGVMESPERWSSVRDIRVQLLDYPHHPYCL